MKIQRPQSGLFARRASPRRGCAPLLVLFVVAAAVVVLGRDWMRLNLRHGLAPMNLAAAQAAFDRGDLSAAIAAAQQVLERDATDEAAYVLLIRALIYRSYVDYAGSADRAQALAFSQEALAVLPRSLSAQAAHGYALQANGQAEAAGRLALLVIESAPQHILARIVLSLSYGARGIFDAALREAELALSLAQAQRRYELESYRALAIAQGDRGNYRLALAQLEHALAFNNRLIPLHFETAHYAQQIRNFDLATVSYYRILTLDESNVKARARLCELSNRLQERASARTYCREVTQLAPQWATGWYKLGREYFLGGEYAPAQAAFARCAQLQVEQNVAVAERQLECWYLQGQSAEIRGDCLALMTVYEQFLEMARGAGLPQTWVYPPGGPPVCATARARGG